MLAHRSSLSAGERSGGAGLPLSPALSPAHPHSAGGASGGANLLFLSSSDRRQANSLDNAAFDERTGLFLAPSTVSSRALLSHTVSAADAVMARSDESLTQAHAASAYSRHQLGSAPFSATSPRGSPMLRSPAHGAALPALSLAAPFILPPPLQANQSERSTSMPEQARNANVQSAAVSSSAAGITGMHLLSSAARSAARSSLSALPSPSTHSIAASSAHESRSVTSSPASAPRSLLSRQQEAHRLLSGASAKSYSSFDTQPSGKAVKKADAAKGKRDMRVTIVDQKEEEEKESEQNTPPALGRMLSTPQLTPSHGAAHFSDVMGEWTHPSHSAQLHTRTLRRARSLPDVFDEKDAASAKSLHSHDEAPLASVVGLALQKATYRITVIGLPEPELPTSESDHQTVSASDAAASDAGDAEADGDEIRQRTKRSRRRRRHRRKQFSQVLQMDDELHWQDSMRATSHNFKAANEVRKPIRVYRNVEKFIADWAQWQKESAAEHGAVESDAKPAKAESAPEESDRAYFEHGGSDSGSWAECEVVEDTAASASDSARTERSSAPSAAAEQAAAEPALDGMEEPHNAVWINVEDADESVITRIGEHLALHPLTVEDCCSSGIREKLEVFPSYLFLVIHCLIDNDNDYQQFDRDHRGKRADRSRRRRKKSAKANRKSKSGQRSDSEYAGEGASLLQHLSNIAGADSGGSAATSPRGSPKSKKGYTKLSGREAVAAMPATAMENTPLRLVIFPNFVISFHIGGLPSIARLRAVLGRIYQNNLPSTGWLVHALFDAVIHSFRLRVESACHAVDQTDTMIHSLSQAGSPSEAKSLLQRLSWMGRRLGFLRQRLWSKRDLLLSLMERDWQTFIDGVNIPYLRDVHDHIVTSLYSIEAHIEIHSAFQTSYLSSMSIDVAHKAHRANLIMKKLTSVATIILPLSLVTSIMGMNCTVPFQAGAEPTFGELVPFLTFCAAMALTAQLLYVFFRSRNVL